MHGGCSWIFRVWFPDGICWVLSPWLLQTSLGPPGVAPNPNLWNGAVGPLVALKGRERYGGFLSQGGTPKPSHFCRIFPYKPSSYWGTPILGNLHIAVNSDWGKAIEVVGLAWSVCQCASVCSAANLNWRSSEAGIRGSETAVRKLPSVFTSWLGKCSGVQQDCFSTSPCCTIPPSTVQEVSHDIAIHARALKPRQWQRLQAEICWHIDAYLWLHIS